MTTLSKQERDLEFFPDPWEVPITNPNNNFVSNSVGLIIGIDRLLPVTKEPKVLQQANSQLSSILIIIKDWLKLKTQVTQNITDRVREAIVLLLLLSRKSQLP